MNNWRAKVVTERWALVPLRVAVGFGFAFHGYAKIARGVPQFTAILGAIGVPAAGPMAWATTGLELCGGVCLMAGLFVRPLAIPLAAVMLTAWFGVHLPYGFSGVKLLAITQTGARFGPTGYELNVLYIAALVTLALGGPTPLSLARRSEVSGSRTPT